MRNIIIALLFLTAGLMSGCYRSSRSTGVEYASQMMHSMPLEPYSQTEPNPYFANKTNAQAPVDSAVARDRFVYPYPKSNEGYEQAGTSLKSPLPFTQENIAEGKRLMGFYCSHCHGAEGLADGAIIKAGKFPPPPSFDSQRIKDTPEGKMYHSIYFGRNLMGGHGSQLYPNEIWQIIQFIRTVRGEAPGAEMTSTTELKKEDAKK